MSTAETTTAAFRCKICLLEAPDVATYDTHIQSFTDTAAYARHISQRPPGQDTPVDVPPVA